MVVHWKGEGLRPLQSMFSDLKGLFTLVMFVNTAKQPSILNCDHSRKKDFSSLDLVIYKDVEHFVYIIHCMT